MQALFDTEALRASIRDEYATVATEPERGFHFLDNVEFGAFEPGDVR